MTKLIAFYLPQYYPFQENDEWWGKGFTEWTNVTKAKPLFADHYQPHLPTDLGFYDLRVRETRHEQIRLAKEFGIYGFCYHYYWFSGKRLLDAPLEDMLKDSASDMPFCISWANENWTRRWDASDKQVLIAQKYRPDDDVHLADDLCRHFADPRYIKVGDAPLFLVYRPQQLPDHRRSTEVWRARAAAHGFPNLHLSCALTHGNREVLDGFDSGVEFPPHNLDRTRFTRRALPSGEHLRTISYAEVAESYLRREYSHPVFSTVFPSWDNTARRGERGIVVTDGTPHNYECWLDHAIRRRSSGPNLPFVFVNAWNEWAEGCHLEPDRRYERGFLEATRRVMSGTSKAIVFETSELSLPRKDSKMIRGLLRIGRQLRSLRTPIPPNAMSNDLRAKD